MNMKTLAIAVLLLVSRHAVGETTTLSLPEGAALAFEGPKMVTLKEVNEDGRYQYVAASLGGTDTRFNLSVHVEPIDCQHGKSLKDVTRCFTDRMDQIPGVIKDSSSPHCDRRRCEIFYGMKMKVGEKTVLQLHANTLFTYRGAWVDVHFSALNPDAKDSKVLAHFASTLKFAE